MYYASINENDIVDSDNGIAVSLWFKGCDFKCKCCQNRDFWEFDENDIADDNEVIEYLKDLINKNNIKRNFSVLGGEPLHPKNRQSCAYIIKNIREAFPDIKIFLWTGYVYEDLLKENDKNITDILNNIDVLIDGPFIVEKKNLNLKLRGSSNQRILYLKNGKILNCVN